MAFVIARLNVDVLFPRGTFSTLIYTCTIGMAGGYRMSVVSYGRSDTRINVFFLYFACFLLVL